VGGERRELRGHQQTAGKFSSTVTAPLASLAQRYGSERSAEFGRVNSLRPTHTRARHHRAVPADRPAGAPMRLTRSSRRCGCWPTSTRRIPFSRNSFSRLRLGANDGAQADGARAVSGDGEVANDAAVAGDEVDGAVSVLAVSVLAWSGRRQVRWVASAASYGVINKPRANSPALSLPRLPRSLNATAPKDRQNLAALTRFVRLTRARGTIERCQPTDPPVRRCD